MLLRALIAAIKAHSGQRDKGGKPYIFHPIRVALNSKGRDAKIVALLHDVVEDTDYDIDRLGLGAQQLRAIDLLTKGDDIPYIEYIEQIKRDPIAREVKKNDLLDNMNLDRLKDVTPKDIERNNKYKVAYSILSN